MDKKTKIVWKPIDDLIPYEHNAKEHNIMQIENIAKSMMFQKGRESEIAGELR